MSSQEDIKAKLEELAIYRSNLAHLLRQAAQYGGEIYAPLSNKNDIQGSRENIRRLKEILRSWKVEVDDHPDDRDSTLIAGSLRVDPQVAQMIEKLHQDLIQAYNAAKKVRRSLRARAREISHNEAGEEVTLVEAAPYEEQMQKLMDIQLEFEALKERVEDNWNPFLGSEEIKSLGLCLRKIESYLNEIVKEYEGSYEWISKGSLCPIEKLPRLREFIIPARTSENFRTKFQAPKHEAVEILRKPLGAQP